MQDASHCCKYSAKAFLSSVCYFAASLHSLISRYLYIKVKLRILSLRQRNLTLRLRVSTAGKMATPSQGPRPDEVALGQPCAKPLMTLLDGVVISISLLCLALSICVISPSLSLAWSFDLKAQLTVIGLLLSVMHLCLQAIVPTTWIALEARWGRSRLQAYDAILRNNVTRPETAVEWRAVLALFICLPVALSVAYKQFIGGEASIEIPPNKLPSDRKYGFFPPTNTSALFFNSFANAPYLLTNATYDFFEKSANDDAFPFASIARGDPIPYGYNLLLLGNDSAAALDLPSLSYLSEIRSPMSGDEGWTMSASVYGLVTQLNKTVESLRDDDDFWNATVIENRGFNGLTSFGLFRGSTSLGIIPYLMDHSGTLSCFLGMYYPSQTFWSAYYQDPHDPDILAFRNATLMFTTRRVKCSGSWRVTRDSIQLLTGACPSNDDNVGSPIFSQQWASQFSPFPLDALPILVHSLNAFPDTRADSPWKVPSYTMAVAAMYWARGAFMLLAMQDTLNSTITSPDIIYPPMQESVTSTRAALDPAPLLYFVLAIQPFITVVAALLNILLYSTPVSKDFGLVSILSGVDLQTVALLKGAGFSGRLKQNVTLRISVAAGQLKYALSASEKGGGGGRLERKTVYA